MIFFKTFQLTWIITLVTSSCLSFLLLMTVNSILDDAVECNELDIILY